jgi:hypothetical protein
MILRNRAMRLAIPEFAGPDGDHTSQANSFAAGCPREFERSFQSVLEVVSTNSRAICVGRENWRAEGEKEKAELLGKHPSRWCCLPGDTQTARALVYDT